MKTEEKKIKTKEDLLNWLSVLNCLMPSDWKCIEETMCMIEDEFPCKLRQHFLVLSEDDIRIILLLRAGIWNVEIARLLNILPASFRMRRYRIKKKMSVTEKKLSDFVQGLFK